MILTGPGPNLFRVTISPQPWQSTELVSVAVESKTVVVGLRSRWPKTKEVVVHGLMGPPWGDARLEYLVRFCFEDVNGGFRVTYAPAKRARRGSISEERMSAISIRMF